MLELVALGGPRAHDLGLEALEHDVQGEQRAGEALGIAFLRAQAEQGHALSAHVRFLVQAGEELLPVGLEATGAAPGDVTDPIAGRAEDQGVVLHQVGHGRLGHVDGLGGDRVAQPALDLFGHQPGGAGLGAEENADLAHADLSIGSRGARPRVIARHAARGALMC